MLSSIVYLTASQREERRKRGEKEGRREGGREGTFSLLYLNLKVFDNTLSPVRVRPPSLPPSFLCTAWRLLILFDGGQGERERARVREPEGDGGKNRRVNSSGMDREEMCLDFWDQKLAIGASRRRGGALLPA